MILIYLNTGEWGGVDVFVMRFVEYLRRHNREFVIVDKAGSRLRQDLPWAKFITPDEARTRDLPIDRVFFPSLAKVREDGIPWERLRDAQVFAWIVHHNDTVVQFFPHSYWIIRKFGFAAMRRAFWGLRWHHKRIEKMLDLMVRYHALSAMDEGTARAVEYFYPKLPGRLPIIPVPAPIDEPINGVSPAKDAFTFGYLGRMDEVKFSALGPFVENNLVEIAKTRRVRLLAITVGTHVEDLKETCANAGVELDLRGFLPNHEARELLRNQTHLGLAMGTAALDIAATGHPCIYIDPAERSGTRPQTSFRFVHETDNFTLGQYRDFPIYPGGVRSLQETVRLIEEDPTIGIQGRDYVRMQHNPDVISKTMLEYIEKSTLIMSDLKPYVEDIINSNNRDLIFIRNVRRFQKHIRMVIGRRSRRSLSRSGE